MKVRTSRRSFLALESVAMTDIVMNLFIFFFISFSLLTTFNPKREARIDVKLPQGAATSAAKADSPLEVSVTARNEIFIGKTRIPQKKLKEELASRAKFSGPSGVLVRADKTASVDVLVKVLDAAKQAGWEKLGVAIERQ
jgi:biopolymer transport protein ExbD